MSISNHWFTTFLEVSKIISTKNNREIQQIRHNPFSKKVKPFLKTKQNQSYKTGETIPTNQAKEFQLAMQV
jgi:hypothetical protein